MNTQCQIQNKIKMCVCVCVYMDKTLTYHNSPSRSISGNCSIKYVGGEMILLFFKINCLDFEFQMARIPSNFSVTIL
jgi:hypothetical protein